MPALRHYFEKTSQKLRAVPPRRDHGTDSFHTNNLPDKCDCDYQSLTRSNVPGTFHQSWGHWEHIRNMEADSRHIEQPVRDHY